MREEWFHWVALSLIPGVGKITYRNVIEHYHAPDKVFSSSVEELRKGARLKEESIAAIKNFRLEDEVRAELKGIEEHGVTLITLKDDRYPKNLYHIPDPPPYLYVKGSFRESDGLAVAVVGSRFASSYGKETAQKLTEDLARAGVTIVSGMARGIDSCAHRAAIAAGGRTIAVLGCGIDVDYPPENAKLKREIVESGAVVSEVPLSTPPSASNFPGRNRLISGLSLGVVVVEASLRSGSLITARLALEQGREVFAVPGSIDSVRSKGTHTLIKQGAKLVEHVQDIMVEIQPQYAPPPESESQEKLHGADLTDEARIILEVLDQNQLHIDTIIAQTSLDSSLVSSTLLDLELGGLVRQMSGKLFSRTC